MKKFLNILLVFILIFMVSGCGKVNDASKFEKEYEALNNNVIEGTDYKVREVDIPSDNPIVYLDIKDASNVLREETAIIYFGFSSCPWCRSVIETLLEVAKDLNIKKIYYVDIKDERDKLELVDGEVVMTKKASDSYYELLKIMDEYLDDYTLTDKDGNIVNTGEKRIYAPNVVASLDGKILGVETGISCLQENAFEEITEEMHNETYDVFKCLLEETIENDNACDINKAC